MALTSEPAQKITIFIQDDTSEIQITRVCVGSFLVNLLWPYFCIAQPKKKIEFPTR